jgi:hypothetical protein
LCVEKFICAVCEYKCLAFNETHTRKHTLVRVVRKVEKSSGSTEERLKAVEGQLGSVQGKLGSVEGQLGSVQGKLGSVQDELLKMRQLFEKLFEKGMEGSPSDPITKGDILGAAMTGPNLRVPPSAKGDDGQDGEEEDKEKAKERN